MSALIASIHNPPPGGLFFADVGGVHIEAPTWYQMEGRVASALAAAGRSDELPLAVVSECMCPHMPPWFCLGSTENPRIVRRKEALSNAAAYFSKRLVRPIDIERRLDVCRQCPKHEGSDCLTCSGTLNWILRAFGGRRPAVMADRASRICACARTYESVVASVAYGADEPVWDDVPDTCWRKNR